MCLIAAALQPTPRLLWMVMGGVTVIAALWSAWLASGVLGQQPLFDEEGREMMGLALIALWLGISAAVGWRQRLAKAPSEAS